MIAELEELRVQRDLMSARCVELAARLHQSAQEIAALKEKLSLFERHGQVPDGHMPKLPAELMRGRHEV